MEKSNKQWDFETQARLKYERMLKDKPFNHVEEGKEIAPSVYKVGEMIYVGDKK